jgi:hypothetical protein
MHTCGEASVAQDPSVPRFVQSLVVVQLWIAHSFTVRSHAYGFAQSLSAPQRPPSVATHVVPLHCPPFVQSVIVEHVCVAHVWLWHERGFWQSLSWLHVAPA